MRTMSESCVCRVSTTSTSRKHTAIRLANIQLHDYSLLVLRAHGLILLRH